jgi:transcriptional regulator with XRE-family HTH domain
VAITPTGARHRVTALMALGWSPAALAAETGLDERAIAGRPQDLERKGQAALDQIGGAYERLWNTPPPERTREERATADLFREHAREVGWAPPMAWDDDLIDRPDVRRPDPGWQRSDRSTGRAADRAEDVHFLRDHGGYHKASDSELAMRLGISKDTLQQALRQAEMEAG